MFTRNVCAYAELVLKVYSLLTFAFTFASTSPSKFNIAPMETPQRHRMGLDPFLTFYIDAMLNVDANANANVECEHTITSTLAFTSNVKKGFYGNK